VPGPRRRSWCRGRATLIYWGVGTRPVVVGMTSFHLFLYPWLPLSLFFVLRTLVLRTRPRASYSYVVLVLVLVLSYLRTSYWYDQLVPRTCPRTCNVVPRTRSSSLYRTRPRPRTSRTGTIVLRWYLAIATMAEIRCDYFCLFSVNCCKTNAGWI